MNSPDAHSTSPSPEAIGPAIRIPHRCFWLKRILVGYFLFLIGVMLLSYSASRLLWHRLDVQIQAIRARGEPVLIDDFAERSIPDEENAAFYLKRAAASLEKISEEEGADVNDLPTKLPLSAADVTLIGKLTAKYAASLQDIRTARGKTGINWGVNFSSPAIGTLLPWLGSQRSSSRLLRSAALNAYQQGDEAAAVEFVRDLLAIALASDQSPFLVSHLVALGIGSEGATTAQAIAPTLHLADVGAPLPAGIKPATRQQLRALLAELLDDREIHSGLTRSMQGERLFQLDTALCIADRRIMLSDLSSLTQPHGPSASVASVLAARLIRPMVLNEARDMLAWSSRLVDAFAQDSLPATTAKMPPIPNSNARYRSPLMSVLLPSFNAVATRHYGALFQQRKAALALAERLYQLDHGRGPQRLEDLVPDYLPQIPIDPFAGDNKPMPFVPTTQPATMPVGQL